MQGLKRRLPEAVSAGRRFAFFVTSIALLGGCSLNSKPEQPQIMASQGLTASVEALRSAVLGQSEELADAIERAADSIAALSNSPEVRSNALEWKLVSSTELQSAALRRDPSVALGDLILFNLQMHAYLTTGD